MNAKVSKKLTTNKEAYTQVIKECIMLNEIGSAIKTRRFPFVVKKLGLRSLEKTSEELKPNFPKLKLEDETFKTLPSLRNSSYQTYRQASNILKEYQNKPDLSYNKIIWGPETVIASNTVFEVQKPKRTQIMYAEKLFAPKSGSINKKQSPSLNLSHLKFEEIYQQIKTRSEKKVSEIASFRSTF